MSRPEERMRRAADTISRGIATRDVLERLARRRRRTIGRRRASTALVSVVVVAGTALGTSVLRDAIQPAASGGGQVAFVRFLRGCEAHPNTSGQLDLFAVDVATGEERRISQTDAWPDGSSMAERDPDVSPDGSKVVWTDHYRSNIYVTDIATGETDKVLDGSVLPTPEQPDPPILPPFFEPGVARPRISPDGTRVLFQAEGAIAPLAYEAGTHIVEEASAIYLMDLSGGTPQLVTNGHLATWTGDGRIAFARSSLEVTVTREGESMSVNDRPVSLEFFLIDPDGTNEERVYEAPADTVIEDAEWSPDGSRVAAQVVDQDNTDIFVLDLNTRIATRLTRHGAEDTAPTWSPDGEWIAFQTGRYGDFTGHAEIAMAPASGGDVVRLTRDACWQDTDPTWIEDPTTVDALSIWQPPPLPDLGRPGVAEPDDILVDATVDAVSDLYAVDPATGAAVNLTSDVAVQGTPSWSPDRSWIAFTADSGDTDDVNLDIYVMRPDGTDIRRLTTSLGSESRPSWSPDGTRLAYEADDGVWVIDADGSDPRHVGGTSCGGGCYPSWSPDGSEIVHTSGGIGLVIAAADGSRERRIPGGAGAYDPAWSPDGSTIVFACGSDICSIGVEGGDPTNLTSSAAYEAAPDWSPDGSRIVYTSERGGLWLMDADGTNAEPLDIRADPPLDSVHEPSW